MALREYIVRRVLKLPLIVLAVSVIVFGLTRLGGSPIAIYTNHEMTPDQVAEVAARYGLDQSLPEQYVAWLRGVLTGDLGWSGVSVAPVTEVLPEKLAATLELSVAAAIIAFGLGVALGTYGGSRRNKAGDHVTRLLSAVGASFPLFWAGLLALIVFYLFLGWAPLGRSDPVLYARISHPTGLYTVDALLSGDLIAFMDAVRHLALPALVLGVEGTATIARVMRSSIIEALNEDYVDAARGRGLSERLILRRHARHNALVPAVTMMGVSAGLLLQGAVVIEIIFGWPGMGRWIADAVLRGDQATLMAAVLVASVVFILVNLAVDIAYAYLDPRVALGT